MRTLKQTAIAAAVALGFATAAYADQQSQSKTQSSQGSQSSQQAKQQGEQKKGIVTVSGKVVGNADIKTTAGDLHHVVKVQTTKGKNVVVDLGFKAPTVSQGDRIFVSGHSARISGKPVVFARYVGKLEEVAMPSGKQSASAGGSSGKAKDWTGIDWTDDRYGYYDPDLKWTADNSGFTSFYGDADDAWGALYDDVGDEGWFDV